MYPINISPQKMNVPGAVRPSGSVVPLCSKAILYNRNDFILYSYDSMQFRNLRPPPKKRFFRWQRPMSSFWCVSSERSTSSAVIDIHTQDCSSTSEPLIFFLERSIDNKVAAKNKWSIPRVMATRRHEAATSSLGAIRSSPFVHFSDLTRI